MRASLSCEDRGWVSGDRVLAHSRWQPRSKALLYKQGNQRSKGPIMGCARGPGRAGWEHATDCTKIRPSLHPGSPCAAVSKERPLLPYWEADSNAWGAEHSGRAGPVLLHLALMSVPRPPKGLRQGWAPLRLRTGPLEQTTVSYTHSISLGLLASERETSARWCLTEAAHLHNNPGGTEGSRQLQQARLASPHPRCVAAPLP